MKFCKDCTHCVTKTLEVCNVLYKSPITGETQSLLCVPARSSELYCGAEAKYFEAKDGDGVIQEYALYLKSFS